MGIEHHSHDEAQAERERSNRELIANTEAAMMAGTKVPTNVLTDYLSVRSYEFSLHADSGSRTWRHRRTGTVYCVVGLLLRCVDDPTIPDGSSRLELMVRYSEVSPTDQNSLNIRLSPAEFCRRYEDFVQKFRRVERGVIWNEVP